MDLCFNKIVRTACGGFLLMLTGAISGAQVGWISFDGQTLLHAITDTKGGDRSVEFRLQGREAIVDFLLSPGSDDVTLAQRFDVAAVYLA
jgi:hypothetical protein